MSLKKNHVDMKERTRVLDFLSKPVNNNQICYSIILFTLQRAFFITKFGLLLLYISNDCNI